MLLIHQVGSVKIGEIIRYTITYTPSQDRILPSPEKLHVRIRNTTAIALRAAFVHGPYTLSVASYPSHFDPNKKFENTRRYGTPQFEPMLKAGGSWECELVVPDNIRQSAGVGSHGGFGKAPEHDTESASWIIEVTSQVVFSASASVGFEVVVARDYKSLSISQSLPVVSGQSQVPRPGNVTDLQQSVGAKDGHHAAQPKGVFSRAIHVKVEDTASLWNTPRLPGWDDEGGARLTGTSNKDQPVESMVQTGDSETAEETPIRNQKKVHLVILTHGLHSNLGADMLFMKESIDKAAKTARVDAKARKARKREEDVTGSTDDVSSTDNNDYEEMIVRGYSGNAAKTEKGIKYLGKRLARYVLSLTYPDQPFIPIGKGAGDGLTEGFLIHEVDETQLKRSHKHSDMVKDTIPDDLKKHRRPYKVTSISFVGHSLGGLVQTYAVAYIQKHSPDFFDLIKPINFIALASPFLGLSNENPLYVKFALDFGLVGRTGKDLGLTWRAPTIARNGWGAIVSNLGETAHKKVYGESRPESKPLLRILPTGPAHIALKKFRNRTVYSNVVNDGIVPLRTSCLLFLDWQGLGRVEKARREAGLVETMVGFGWAELTGTNMAAPKQRPRLTANNRVDSDTSTAAEEDSQKVPQPDDNTMDEDDRASLRSLPTPFSNDATPEAASSQEPSTQGPLSGFFNLFRNNDAPKPQQVSAKQRKMLRRGQTIHFNDATNTPASSNSDVSKDSKGSKVTSGQELEGVADSVAAPPKTTIFESAGDLLNPQRPEIEYIIDPSHRPRAIFHDRVYHPADIPQPPLKKRTTSSLMRRSASKTPTINSQQSASSDTSSTYQNYKHEDPTDTTKDYDDTANTNPHKRSDEVIDGSNMRVEEKIARGYHRDLAWRKVLVKLEPDAHNNIIVRRMFVNAHGWPVIKHLVDAHFSDSATARTRTEDEHLGERALDMNQPPDKHGGETKTVSVPDPEKSTVDTSTVDSEAAEARDEVTDLPKMQESEDSFASQPSLKAADSITWSERDWIDSENESNPDTEEAKKTESQGQTPMANKEEADTPTWNWTEKIVGKSATEPRT